MTFLDLQSVARSHLSILRERSWIYWLKEFVMAFVGLFVLDIAWRFMDWIIDAGIIAHVGWLKFLGDG